MKRFTLPRDLYFERGSIEVIKNLEGKKAVIVTGGNSMKKTGFLAKTEQYLKEAGMETMIIDGVEPDPSVETVMEGADKMLKFEPDWIVSIGGGSAIDAAKAMWVFYEHPEITFDDIKDPFTIPVLRKKAKFVAIPSTSGTATEVTAFSVVTDYKVGIKYPLADYEITPDVAIVDPDVADSMPKKVVAHTGMDALTHALEAYVASNRSDFTDPLAIQAIKMVIDNVIAAYNGDKDAKEKMHIAQCLAGMAFTNALLGITHSMAHKTGAIFSIPHGCANAIYLPYVIDWNKKEVADRYAEVARCIGLQGENDEELINNLNKKIKELNLQMLIANSLKDYGIDESEFLGNLDRISENAAKDACTGSNPRVTEAGDFKKLFKAVYYGDKVNF